MKCQTDPLPEFEIWQRRRSVNELIRKRVEKLAARIFPSGSRQHTFEELCRLMWRQDKRGFLALANGDCPLRVFVTSFDRDDAERATRGPAPIRARKTQK
jgi:hypothetical protein